MIHVEALAKNSAKVKVVHAADVIVSVSSLGMPKNWLQQLRITQQRRTCDNKQSTNRGEFESG
jgi:hypothetical protein